LNAVNHLNWRQRGFQKLAETEQEGIHYTAVHSLSADDYLVIRNLILKMLEDSRKVVEPSKEEELICLCCDVFKV
jgi:hypothetical protein